MKTPEDIKKTLACDCDWPDCEGCVYAEKVIDEEFGELTRYHCSQIYKDALEYIQQLESRLEQVERERDAAVRDIDRCCGTCKHFIVFFNGCTPDYDCKNPAGCLNVSGRNTGWEWRGVCEENTKEKEK